MCVLYWELQLCSFKGLFGNVNGIYYYQIDQNGMVFTWFIVSRMELYLYFLIKVGPTVYVKDMISKFDIWVSKVLFSRNQVIPV